MRLSKLAETVIGQEYDFEGTREEREICSLFTDSREKTEKGLFFCLIGENTDSHECVAEAIKNGAVAVVTERKLEVKIPQIIVSDTREALAKMSAVFYGDPSLHMKIIGITGTNGKTTTSYMVASILEKAGKKVGVIGTLGVVYGGRKIDSGLTTPDPIFLQKTLAEMFIFGIEYVVMEVSAHALFYKKVSGVHFSVCIFTNFTQDHLDFFGTMQAYKKAKSALFSEAVCPIAIINGDDEVGRELGVLREKAKEKTVFYGLNTPADAFAIITDETLYGSECMLNVNDALCRITLSMAGIHNVYNALAAGLCASELGVGADFIAKGLSSMKQVSGRLEKIGEYNGGDIYVDFAHTPDGLEKSLHALRKHCKARLICLFGCGGNRDKTKRPLMGEIAAKTSDFTILTSDNPRYEDPLDIISDVEKGYRRFSVRYVVVPERKKALDYAMGCLKKGDVLLVAGKGGEEYQEIMGIKYPFNDHDIIEKWLQEKKKES